LSLSPTDRGRGVAVALSPATGWTTATSVIAVALFVDFFDAYLPRDEPRAIKLSVAIVSRPAQF
jgi:hypothetical protein